MTEAINPALTDQPETGVSIGAMRGRLAVAFAVHGNEFSEPARMAFADAIGQSSPVDAIVGAFSVIEANAADCGPVLLSRGIEVAELISAQGFHGKGEDATAFMTAARATLAELAT